MIQINSVFDTGSIEQTGAACANGTSLQLVALEGLIETLPVGLTSYTSKLQLPPGYKIILCAGWRVATEITGITTIAFGIAGLPTYFTDGDTPSLVEGSTVIYPGLKIRYDAASTSLFLSSIAGPPFGGGSVRFSAQYLTLTPPSV